MPPSAVGTLEKTPLAHALVYVRNRRLTGRFELRTPDGRGASLSFHRGRITGALTSPPVAYFGSVAYELGLIDGATLDASLLELSKKSEPRRLHGEILVARGALTAERRDEVLVEQICRKVHHLFTFPDTTQYAFHDARPGIDDPPLAVDPIAPAWRGLRDYPPAKSIDDVLVRVGTSPLKMVNEDAVGRARLARDEAALAQKLAESPMTVSELRAATTLPSGDVDLLIYLLVIAKCIEPLSGARAAPSIGAMPAVSAPTHPSMPAVRAAHPHVTTAQSGALPAVQPASSSFPPATRPPTLRPVVGPMDLGAAGLAARAQAIDAEDYFEVLGVDRGASAEVIRAAYFRLAKLWHPDRLPADLLPFHSEVTHIFAHMTRAQQTLCDPEARKRWMEGHALTVRKRPREDFVREIDQALAKKDFVVAESVSRRLAEADAEDAEALALLAWAAAHAGDAPEDALRSSLHALDHAVNVDRTCERALYYRGLVAKKLGKLDAAFRDFARVAHLNPKHIDAVREVRLFEMRARKGSGEHALGHMLDKVKGQKKS